MIEYSEKNNTSTERFFSAFTPIWFDLLEWVALLAGLQVLNSKHHDQLLNWLLVLSLLFLLQYLMALCSRFRLPISAGATRWQTFLRIAASVIFTSCLGWTSYYLAQRAIFLLAEFGKT